MFYLREFNVLQFYGRNLFFWCIVEEVSGQSRAKNVRQKRFFNDSLSRADILKTMKCIESLDCI